MPKKPNRGKPAADPRTEGQAAPAPGHKGGIEGGTILVALLIGAGLVLMVLKLLGVLG